MILTKTTKHISRVYWPQPFNTFQALARSVWYAAWIKHQGQLLTTKYTITAAWISTKASGLRRICKHITIVVGQVIWALQVKNDYYH